ncbi:iron-sulfur cluster repair di-iron protein [Salinicoccus hispanicus]|uniref:Iron-sulfur cluster repair di-iron protein n=1 Tax=Salinicoccus hispanicus TaxID=157225 RepID=A0A6N8U3S4_9STAP|nr:iron-sulfur cluster repair di-iron protein [Salinicoccus hispanicus]MXQ51095.1 iron-sulfur cluster repair di-iron protein [Salinicoccus hispanicus]
MTAVSEKMWVSDIVKEVPKSADIFRRNRIDYCCGGRMPLGEAVEARGLDLESVMEEINSIDQHEGGGLDVRYLDEAGIITFIQNRYHQELLNELSALTPYVTKLARKHGPGEPHLVRLQELYRTLKNEMIAHTEDEDRHVFPLIIEFMKDPASGLVETVKPHVDGLEADHEAVGDILKEMRDITDDFTPHEAACGTYQLVYARLEKIEKDTFDHVHLENNVLFERVKSAM